MGSDAMRKLASDGDRRYREYMEEASTAIKFSDLPVPDVNPFRFRLRDKMNIQRVVKGAYNGVSSVDIIDRMSGEVVSGAEENRVFVKRESVDNDKFVKLYSDRIKAMFDLSYPAIKVFGYFLKIMQQPENINKDMVYFDVKECMEFCGYNTHPMVYNGLKELCSHGFIARCPRPNHFYVDANTAFNGNRVIIMEEYVRKDTPSALSE